MENKPLFSDIKFTESLYDNKDENINEVELHIDPSIQHYAYMSLKAMLTPKIVGNAFHEITIGSFLFLPKRSVVNPSYVLKSV